MRTRPVPPVWKLITCTWSSSTKVPDIETAAAWACEAISKVAAPLSSTRGKKEGMVRVLGCGE